LLQLLVGVCALQLAHLALVLLFSVRQPRLLLVKIAFLALLALVRFPLCLSLGL
jgi:hypothetical protein